MGFDFTQLLTDAKLNDHVEKPIVITIKDFSQKYNIVVTLQAIKKEA